MKKKIAEEWAARLRSGEYKQITGKLDNGKGYCCLGVLTTIALEEGVVEYNPPDRDNPHGSYGEGKRSAHLPKEVVKWAGLKSCNGNLELGCLTKSLTDLNDVFRSDFAEIASVIEKHWREL